MSRWRSHLRRGTTLNEPHKELFDYHSLITYSCRSEHTILLGHLLHYLLVRLLVQVDLQAELRDSDTLRHHTLLHLRFNLLCVLRETLIGSRHIIFFLHNGGLSPSHSLGLSAAASRVEEFMLLQIALLTGSIS